MSLPNYRLEGEVRATCIENAVLPSAVEDYIDDLRAGRFDQATMVEYIKQTRETKPHRFTLAGTEYNDLFVEAFGANPSLTAQGRVVRLLGEDQAAVIAAQFNTRLGSTKPGTPPANIKSAAADDFNKPNNPWSAHPINLDERGRYNAAAIGKQARVIHSLGEAKAAQIAHSANGAKIGDTAPRRKA